MLGTTSLDRVGEFLSYALGGLGIIDDYDEILADIEDDDALYEFHKTVMAAVFFALERGTELGLEPDRLIAELERTYQAECEHRGIDPDPIKTIRDSQK